MNKRTLAIAAVAVVVVILIVLSLPRQRDGGEVPQESANPHALEH